MDARPDVHHLELQLGDTPQRRRPVPAQCFLHWFPFDLSVHLRLSPGALRRRTGAGERWTLPAFARYEDEVAPGGRADALVRADDPMHPAWTGWGRSG